MALEATINVSLTPHQLRLVRERVESGNYASASEIVREGLRELFAKGLSLHGPSARQHSRRLAAGYKATAERDRKLARDWAQLSDAWPKK